MRVVGRDCDWAEDSVEDATTAEVDDSTTAAEEAGAAELAGAADLGLSDRSYKHTLSLTYEAAASELEGTTASEEGAAALDSGAAELDSGACEEDCCSG